MNILFTAYCNNRLDLVKISDEMVHETKKVTTKVTQSIKNGFVALLKSISNSFKCMVKMFTVTKVSQGAAYSNLQPQRVYSEVVPTVSVEKEKDRALEDNPFNDASRQYFNKLKAEMHVKLNDVFANRASS